MQRCELGSSSDDKSPEDKESAEIEDELPPPKQKKEKKTDKKTEKEKEKDEKAPRDLMKKPAAKKQKKDEYDGLFDDIRDGGGDNEDPDPDADPDDTDAKKGTKSKRTKKDDGNGKEKKSRKTESLIIRSKGVFLYFWVLFFLWSGLLQVLLSNFPFSYPRTVARKRRRIKVESAKMVFL